MTVPADMPTLQAFVVTYRDKNGVNQVYNVKAVDQNAAVKKCMMVKKVKQDKIVEVKPA